MSFAMAEEVVTELPHLYLFVGKVFVANLNQSHFTVTIQIVFKGFVCDKRKVIIDLNGETIPDLHVVEDREEDDK